MSGGVEKLTPLDCLIPDGKHIKGINYDKAAEMILQNAHILRLAETGANYIYIGGVYLPIGWGYLEQQLYENFKGIAKKNGQAVNNSGTINEILNQAFSRKTISMDSLLSRTPMLNVENGLLDLNTKVLIEHDPDYLMLSQMDVEYDPDAECPMFMDFLDGALAPEYHDSMGELFGYTLWPDHNIQKAFMLLGPRRSGKGTMLRVMQALIGELSTSHIGLQQLCNDRFARAELFGKMLNTFGDLPRDPIRDTGFFKAVTGEDSIMAERKFGQPFNFKNIAKLVYSANYAPGLKGSDDDAFYGRWIIFPFENSVYGHEDPHLTEKLTTPAELSGILNWALDGLSRLRDNGWKFSYTDDAAAIYRRKSKPESAFLEDCCEADEISYVPKADLVKAYNEYAKSLGLPPASSKKAFGTYMLDQTIVPVETYHPMVDGRQVEAWRGIRLKSSEC